MNRERFDVTGKDSTPSVDGQRPTGSAWDAALNAGYEQMREILKNRFGLSLHHEVRELPTLTLVADGKKKFTPVPCDSEYRLQHGFVKGAISMASLTALLKTEYGMPIRDSTGLAGCYYIDAHWTTDPSDDSLPSVVTSLHQLGFQLNKSKGDVDMLIIDHLETPSPD